ncbi:DUF6090 family protein [Croceitalea marina]|uniref:DUF6090 family protein n=1 Tax=Croceitalea marina TaxID=1775166 RepID=A0ABW5MYC0_9FLAO
MIKFFRHIRRSLINQNQMGKYFKYATGEIILVVIGILIALQINNWNENKKVSGSVDKHLEILKQNLNEDKAQLNVLVQNITDNYNYSDSLMMQMKTILPINKHTTKYLTNLLLEHQFRPNTNAIETMTQSNEIPFLETKLQTAILDYYALIESTGERELISNTQLQTKYEPHINDNYAGVYQKNNEWNFIKNYYSDDPRPIRKFDKEKFLDDKKLEGLIVSRYYQNVELKRFYSDLLTSANAILQLL